MENNEIKERLEQIFREIFDDPELKISLETTAEDIEDWDSLTHMQLILKIEKEFNIKFTISEIKQASNVGEFIEIIKEKI